MQVARAIVPDHQLSLAIGREGQNARLAARLTGWKIDIRPESDPADDDRGDRDDSAGDDSAGDDSAGTAGTAGGGPAERAKL